MAKQRGTKLIANNKKAYHDYFIEDTYEAGIALVGTEVKSLRMGKCSIKEAFVGLDGDEVYVYRMNISPYPMRSYSVTKFSSSVTAWLSSSPSSWSVILMR